MSGAAGGLPLPPALQSQQQSISSATWSGRGPAARRESVGRDAPVEEASGLTLGALGLTLGDATPGVFRASAPRPAPPPPQVRRGTSNHLTHKPRFPPSHTQAWLCPISHSNLAFPHPTHKLGFAPSHTQTSLSPVSHTKIAFQEDEEDAGGALTLEALGLSIEDTAAPETGNAPTISPPTSI